MVQPDGRVSTQRSEEERVRQLWRLSDLYHENSKLRGEAGGMQLPVPLDPLRRAAAHSNTRRVQADYDRIQPGATRYPQRPQLALPPAALYGTQDLGDVLCQRRSQRHFSGGAITLQHLATLLYWSYGVTRTADPPQCTPRRAVPSGGGLYPLEVYLCALDVEGLAAGLYHYDVWTHQVTQLALGDQGETLQHLVFYAESLQGAAALLILSAVFERVRFKYGEFGYRIIWADAGCVGQTLSLVATSLGLGSCLMMGFDEDGMNALLGINGVDESALLLMMIGASCPAALPEDPPRQVGR